MLASLGNGILPHPETVARLCDDGDRPVYRLLWGDNWFIGVLLVAFLLFVYISNHTRRQFVLQAKNFLYTPQNADTPFAKDIAINPRIMVLTVLLLCTLGGLILYICARYTLSLPLRLAYPCLMPIYVGCLLAYFLLKRIATGFINWVFFEKPRHKLWNDACSFALSVECLLFCVAVLVLVCIDIPIWQILTALCAVVVFAKMLLAYKCIVIFFPNIHCLLHFLLYLCALEVVPIIALWQSLVCVTDILITEY